jgi:exopolysaccharide biosynthesis polyprenyl glycosylphosphotransferase
MATSGSMGKLSSVDQPSLGAWSDKSDLKRKSSSLAYSAVLIMISDVFAVMLALEASLHLGLHQPHQGFSLLKFTGLAGASISLQIGYLAWFIAALLLVSRASGLYGAVQYQSALHEQRMTVQACLTAGLLLAGALYLTRGEVISRSVVLIMIALTAGILCVRRAISRYARYRQYEKGLGTLNLVILGANQVGETLGRQVASRRHLGYTLRGFLRSSSSELDGDVTSGAVLGSVSQLRQLARQHFIDELIIAAPFPMEQVISIVEEARELDIDVRVVPGFYSVLALNAPIEYLGNFPLIALHHRNAPVLALVGKRIFDVFFSLAVIVATAPLLLVIAIAVRLDGRGSIFYVSERIGKKGRVFPCFKFRTMVPDADRQKAALAAMNERDGILFKMRDDPRVTRVGKLLRKYSLDELPQLFNVLRGEMSIIGPRPPIASEVARYEVEHFRRLEVQPGLTGLWQVQARQDPSFETYIALDTEYVANWSFWLDLKILVLTANVVLRGTGT